MKTVRSLIGISLCFAAALSAASAIHATPLHPAFDLQGPGLSIAVAGVGMSGPTGRSKTLTVTVGGPVELALLYWAGRDHPCPVDPPGSGQCVLPETGPYKDQVLSFGGLLLPGILIGSEVQPNTNAGPINNLGYFADVTDMVRARGTGRLSFTVADGDPGSNLADLDGAGLLVIYSDPAKRDPARVIVYHGLDFAYGEDRTAGSTQVTAPFTFNHGASRATDRQGKLAVFVGDAEGIGPDRIDISRNPSPANRLDGSSGAQWDADVFPDHDPRPRGRHHGADLLRADRPQPGLAALGDVRALAAAAGRDRLLRGDLEHPLRRCLGDHGYPARAAGPRRVQGVGSLQLGGGGDAADRRALPDRPGASRRGQGADAGRHRGAAQRRPPAGGVSAHPDAGGHQGRYGFAQRRRCNHFRGGP